MLLRQHSTLLSSLHFAAKTSFRITLITTIITYTIRCCIIITLIFTLCYLLTRFSWHFFCTRILRASLFSRGCYCSPSQITMMMTLTLGSQWRCHRHVYTALIITLSHFNSSSVNWTASGFSRGSSHSCCRVDVAPWPIRSRSQRGEKCPRLLWSSESPDPSESDVWCVQWWVLVRCHHHVMCPAQLGHKCPTCFCNSDISIFMTLNLLSEMDTSILLLHYLLLFISMLASYKYHCIIILTSKMGDKPTVKDWDFLYTCILLSC